MNYSKLKTLEKNFLSRYPKGFAEPEFKVILKKHNPDKLIEMTAEAFQKEKFKKPDDIILSMTKIISRSSVVSVFEKPKFKDYALSLSTKDKKILANGLHDFLYGDPRAGFEAMTHVLTPGKIAKWPILTTIPVFFKPKEEVFVKPTTAKSILEFFEVKDLIYKPTPTYEFYKGYKDLIMNMIQKTNKSLSPINVAFTGFLMMSLEEKWMDM
ncbi:MAG: hypothetical protein H7A24_12275 [Leptospiraceae bacterium]|nr:hypothetical protein [Leptospiraceae bacterium]MCP5512651.1 hypothetical protein [Leptospiraceae bacterium]